MRRNGLSRILAGVLSVWLVICLAEPAQLHTCVMHGGLAIDAYASGSHHGLSHAHEAASTGITKHSHHQTDSKQSNQCSCLGDCSAGRTLVGIAAPRATFASATIEIQATIFADASPTIVAPHFLRPFSNGPPEASHRA
ncbi:MAG TPA: hypothetical protein VGN73_04605 [Gemmatimonadaceae bacterium]|nr:hypothetical protein [Gemmatimonadaceae bacterium]